MYLLKKTNSNNNEVVQFRFVRFTSTLSIINGSFDIKTKEEKKGPHSVKLNKNYKLIWIQFEFCLYINFLKLMVYL